MKITNFRDYKVMCPNSSKECYSANIDATTGFLWWKTTKTIEIHRELACCWFFVETGKFVLYTKINALERSFLARK